MPVFFQNTGSSNGNHSAGAATLGVELDGVNRTYALTAGLNKVRVMRPFDKLRFTLSSDEASPRITETEITVDHFGE